MALAQASPPLYLTAGEVFMSQAKGPMLEIGQVSQLTGVPPETLRTWERRYQLIAPARAANGRRQYSNADLECLLAVARLVASGQRPSSLVGLSLGALRDRMEVMGIGKSDQHGSVTVALYHQNAKALFASSAVWNELGLTVVDSGPAQILVVEQSALAGPLDSALAEMTAMHQPQSIVMTYAFLNRLDRHVAHSWGVQLEQGPLGSAALCRVIFSCAEVVQTARSVQPAVAQSGGGYSKEVLEALINSDPELVCECPRHLATLAFSLGEFQDYSLRCAVESEEDSDLHKKVAQKTGEAKILIEGVLADVLEGGALHG